MKPERQPFFSRWLPLMVFPVRRSLMTGLISPFGTVVLSATIFFDLPSSSNASSWRNWANAMRFGVKPI